MQQSLMSQMWQAGMGFVHTYMVKMVHHQQSQQMLGVCHAANILAVASKETILMS